MGALSLALEWENRLAVDEISKRHISNAQASQDTFLTATKTVSTEIIHAGHRTGLPFFTISKRVHNMRERDNSHYFVGREGLLAKLSSKLSTHGAQKRVALYGLSGIGKSSLAYQYVTKTNRANPETWIFWVQANTKLQFLQDYLGIASCLQLSGTGDLPVSSQDVSRCLQDSHFGNWVMIVDNVDDSEILEGDEPSVDLIPTNAEGSVIFTTRNRTIAARLVSADNIILVDDPDPDEARDLFCQKANLTYSELCETDQNSIVELLRSLNHLPLAICHAGAFISGQQIAISEYLEIFSANEHARALLLDDESFPQGPVRARPVLLTFSISIDRVLQHDTLAGDLLSFIACVGPRNIPRLLLSRATDSDGVISSAFLKASGLLRAHCLITADSDNQTFDMHAVVHLATRRWLRSRNELYHWMQKALMAVFEGFPSVPSLESDSLSSCAQYLPHAHAVLKYKALSPEFDLPRCLLAHRCSQYLQITGCYNDAELFSTLSANLSGPAFGMDSPAHLTKQEDHGTVLWRNGKFSAAIQLHKTVLESRQRVLGEHKDTLSSLNNLALSLQGLGQYAEAERLHRIALHGRENILGEEHPHTLASLNNISLVLEKQKKYHEGEISARRAVALKRKVYGRENLATLLSVSILAICLQKQGKFSEAEELHGEVLRSRERQLGEQHPLTLNAKLGLIGTLADAGQSPKIEKMARGHFALMSDILGPQHLQALLMAHNLAFILLKLGKNEDAEKLAMQAFMARKKVLGDKHSDTKASEELLDDILDAIKEDMPMTEKKARASFILTRPDISIGIVYEKGLEEAKM